MMKVLEGEDLVRTGEDVDEFFGRLVQIFKREESKVRFPWELNLVTEVLDVVIVCHKGSTKASIKAAFSHGKEEQDRAYHASPDGIRAAEEARRGLIENQELEDR